MKKVLGIGSVLLLVFLNLTLTISGSNGTMDLSFLQNQAIAAGCEVKINDVCKLLCLDDEFSSCSGTVAGLDVTCDDAKESNCP